MQKNRTKMKKAKMKMKNQKYKVARRLQFNRKKNVYAQKRVIERIGRKGEKDERIRGMERSSTEKGRSWMSCSILRKKAKKETGTTMIGSFGTTNGLSHGSFTRLRALPGHTFRTASDGCMNRNLTLIP